MATERDINAAKYVAATNGSDHGLALTFDKAGLRQCDPPLSILDNLPIIDSDSDGKEANDNDNYFK